MEHGHPNKRFNAHLNILRSCIAETFAVTCWAVNLFLQIVGFARGEISIDFFLPFVILAIFVIILNTMELRRHYLRLKDLLSRID